MRWLIINFYLHPFFENRDLLSFTSSSTTSNKGDMRTRRRSSQYIDHNDNSSCLSLLAQELFGSVEVFMVLRMLLIDLILYYG